MGSDSASTSSALSGSFETGSVACSDSSLTSRNTSPPFKPSLPPKEFIPRNSFLSISPSDPSYPPPSSAEQDLLLSMKMESIEFSQEYYLQRATEQGFLLPSSSKTLDPSCGEFKPKSFIYSGIPTPSASPSRPKDKSYQMGEKKGSKKKTQRKRDGEREWEWNEAELEVVKNVWEEEGRRSGSNGVDGNGGVGGGGRGRGRGDGDDSGSAFCSRNAAAGNPRAPRGKSWMIVTQKMMEECSY